jgi:hypothetical protein
VLLLRTIERSHGSVPSFLTDIFTFFWYVEMKGNKSRCYCYLNSKNVVKKVVNDKMIVYKTTKESTAP